MVFMRGNATITGGMVYTSTRFVEDSTAGANTYVTLDITDVSGGHTWAFQDSDDTFVGRDTTDTLTNKTLTLPQISDASGTETYTIAGSDMSGSVTITLPELAGNDTFVFENHTQTLSNKTLTADDVDSTIHMSRIGSSTYSTVQHLQDLYHSSGWASGGDIDMSGTNTVVVTAGTGLVRTSNDQTATLSYFDWSELQFDFSGTSYVHIGIEYNSGSPQVVIYYDQPEPWNYNTDFPLGTVVKNGAGQYPVYTVPHAVGDHANFMIQRLSGVSGIQKDAGTGGLSLSSDASGQISLTSGALWDKLTKVSVSAITDGPFDIYYNVTSGASFTVATAQTTWDSVKYDDGGTLVDISSNNYGVNWFYLDLNGAISMIYGTAEYTTLAAAEDASAPVILPDRITYGGVLLAKIVFLEGNSDTAGGNANVTTYLGAMGGASSGGGVSSHNNLSGLQGGTSAEYFHLTNAQHTEVSTFLSNAVVTSDLNLTGFGTVTIGTADVNGGAIDGTTIGATIPSTAVFTDLTANGNINIDVSGSGNMDGVIIGATTPAAGNFTTVDINGGTIDSTSIGATTPSTGAFTTVTTSTTLGVGTNLTVTGSTTLNGAVTLGNVSADVITVSGTIAGTTPMTFSGGASGGNIIFSMPDPASNITLTFPSATGTVISSTQATFATNVAMGGFKITGLGTPTADADATTKAYVDSLASGLDPKESCRVATTEDFSGATYDTSGTITGQQEVLIIDDITIALNDRVLVKDRADAKENGIYYLTTVGVLATTAWVLTRATDQDGTPVNEVSSGNFTFIEQGTINANTGWVTQGDGILTLNTDNIVWAQFSAAGSLVAGAGLNKNGNSIVLDIKTLSAFTGAYADADTIAINDTDNGQSGLQTGSLSITTLFGNIPVAVNTSNTLTVTGLTTLNGGLTMDGGVFTVSDGSGNVSTTGTLNVSGLASLDGGIDVDGVFTVADTTGNIGTTGTLDVGGLASLDGGIDVDGAFTVANTTGNVSTTGTLQAGATTVTSTLNVSGLTTLNGGLTMDGGVFTVSDGSGNVSTTGTLNVGGLASLDGGIDVDGAFTVADTTGNISTTGTLTVDGVTILKEDLRVGSTGSGNLMYLDASDNTISIGTGDIYYDGTFTTNVLANLDSGIAVSTDKFTVASATGNTVIAGTLTVGGDTAITGRFETTDGSNNFIVDDASGIIMTGNTTITGDLTLTGGLFKSVANPVISNSNQGEITPSVDVYPVNINAATVATTLTGGTDGQSVTFFVYANGSSGDFTLSGSSGDIIVAPDGSGANQIFTMDTIGQSVTLVCYSSKWYMTNGGADVAAA